jgi:hypothetical protein
MNPTFEHQLFTRACTEGIGHVPTDTRQNHFLWEVGTLAAHRHRRSPSLVSPESWGEIRLQITSNAHLRQNPATVPGAGRRVL